MPSRASRFTCSPAFAEPHYTVDELAEWWHISGRTLKHWFENEPGVIKFGTPRLTKRRKRTYVSLRIPESVAASVHLRMTGQEIHRGPAGVP